MINIKDNDSIAAVAKVKHEEDDLDDDVDVPDNETKTDENHEKNE